MTAEVRPTGPVVDMDNCAANGPYGNRWRLVYQRLVYPIWRYQYATRAGKILQISRFRNLKIDMLVMLGRCDDFHPLGQ
jgi:uncharacterized protein (UPF0262 family)